MFSLDLKSLQILHVSVINFVEPFSKIIIADLSTSNPNVYYELGIAHTLNKPVILLTQNISDS